VTSSGPEQVTVVVADDDRWGRMLVRVVLGVIDDGVVVVGEARNGAEALSLIHETHPDVIVLDVDMPKLDGLAAAESVLQQNPDANVVLYTGDPLPRRSERADSLGVVVNDISRFDTLVEELERAIARARRSRQ
jgi:DNA-binding NarL/FixJ family response regulator